MLIPLIAHSPSIPAYSELIHRNEDPRESLVNLEQFLQCDPICAAFRCLFLPFLVPPGLGAWTVAPFHGLTQYLPGCSTLGQGSVTLRGGSRMPEPNARPPKHHQPQA